MKPFRLVVPIVAGLLMTFGTLVAFASGRAVVAVRSGAVASAAQPNASETDLLLGSAAEDMNADASGKLWISEAESHTVRELDPATGAYTLYTGLSQMNNAQLGPDGKLWWTRDVQFGLGEVGEVARMDLGTRLVTTWTVPASAAFGIAFDGNNRAWFVDLGGTGIYRFDPNNHQLCSTALPGTFPGQGPFLNAHDGALWLGDTINAGLARVTSTAGLSPTYTFWPLNNSGLVQQPNGATFAPNGDVWFAEPVSGTIGRLEPGANRVTLFGPPGLMHPQQVAYNAGKVWFTDQTSEIQGTIGFVDPAVASGGTPQVVTPTTTILSLTCTDAGAGSTFTAGISTGMSNFSQIAITPTVNNEGTLYALPGGALPASLVAIGSNLYSADLGRDKLIRLDVLPLKSYLPLLTR